MPDSKIEIKVVTDAQQQGVHLHSMSIEAAKSFSIILESLVSIIASTSGCEDIKVSVVEGSAAAVMEGPIEQISIIEQGFEDTLHHRCTNREVVGSWLSIQKLFKANGIGYEANFYDNLHPRTVVDVIKRAKPFRTKNIRLHPETSLHFIKTQLIEVGGKFANIHFLGEREEKIKASCTRYDATRANEFLYRDILLSVWKTEKPEQRPTYQLCDVYRNEDVYEDLRVFTEFLKTKDEVESLMDIHKKIKMHIQGGEIRRVARIMRLYDHPTTDINILKTILLVTKSFKEQEEIARFWNKLNEHYHTQYNKL